MERTKNSTVFHGLHGHTYMSLTTYKRSGAPVPTPVWFAHDADRLVMLTVDKAAKLKRLRNNPRVTVAPSDGRGKLLGETAEGHGRILPDAEHAAADAALTRKYGWQKRMFTLMMRLRGARFAYIEIRHPGGEAK